MTEHEEGMVAEFLAAIRDPEPIEGLNRQECKLVRTLEAANGRALSRGLLCDAVAVDPLNPPVPSVIDVIVHRIRRKRPEVGIETVRGRGFRWSRRDAVRGAA